MSPKTILWSSILAGVLGLLILLQGCRPMDADGGPLAPPPPTRPAAPSGPVDEGVDYG